MKHFPAGIAVTALFAAMLFFPKAVFNGASEGLLLWFQIIFPTLFPFLVITNLLMSSGGLRFIAGVLGKPFRCLFRVSQNGAFAVLSGFLCGYPMGAKVTADLLRKKLITKDEAQYLLSVCNNTSPIFIINYIVWKTFGDERLLFPTLCILILTPVLLSFIFRRFYLHGRKYFTDPVQDPRTAGSSFHFSDLDACLNDSFEAIVKVGGYIIIFSVLLSLLSILPIQEDLFLMTAPALEMTNGILLLKERIDNFLLCYPAVLALTSFGGLCAAAQTQCMLDGTGLPFFPYIIEKLAAALAASLLAILYVLFLYPS